MGGKEGGREGGRRGVCVGRVVLVREEKEEVTREGGK